LNFETRLSVKACRKCSEIRKIDTTKIITVSRRRNQLYGK